MDITKLTGALIVSAYRTKGYILRTDPDFLNLFGIRANKPDTNTFQDGVGWMTFDGTNWIWKIYPATTEPGFYYLENPMNVEGTHILVPGQYLDSHMLGLHKQEYEAFVQCGKMSFYTDNNKNDVVDMNPDTIVALQSAGVDIHRANPDQTSTVVGKWSAACQVVADPVNFAEMISMAHKHTAIYPNLFSYTLFDELDVFPEVISAVPTLGPIS